MNLARHISECPNLFPEVCCLTSLFEYILNLAFGMEVVVSYAGHDSSLKLFSVFCLALKSASIICDYPVSGDLEFCMKNCCGLHYIQGQRKINSLKSCI